MAHREREMEEKGTDSLKVTCQVASLRGGPGAKEKKDHWHFDVPPLDQALCGGLGKQYCKSSPEP